MVRRIQQIGGSLVIMALVPAMPAAWPSMVGTTSPIEIQIDWMQEYAPYDSANVANDMMVGPDGQIYVTGFVSTPYDHVDLVVLKYNPNGGLVWESRYDGSAGGDDIGKALWVDSHHAYATGWFDGDPGAQTNWEITTLAFDVSTGDTVWTRKLGQGLSRDIVGDNLGNIYVTCLGGPTGSPGNTLTAKYSSVGTLLWQTTAPGGPSGGGFALDLDDTNNVYVAASQYIAQEQMEFLTIKYSTDGVERWSDLHHGVGNQYDRGDYVRELDVNGAGEVVVTGVSDASILNTYAGQTVKYNANGTKAWSGSTWDIQYPTYNTENWDVAMNEAGEVYVAGNSSVTKYSPTGSFLWQQGRGGTRLALDDTGNVYVGGLAKYTPDGDLVWSKSLAPGRETWTIVGISPQDSGVVYLAATAGNFEPPPAPWDNSGIFTARYSPVPPDTTPPMLIGAVIQNPYLTDYLRFMIKSNEMIPSQSLDLDVNGTQVTASMHDRDNFVFNARYRLTGGTQNVAVTTCALDEAGNEGCLSMDFSATRTTAGYPSVALSADGILSVGLSAVTTRDAYVIIANDTPDGAIAGWSMDEAGVLPSAEVEIEIAADAVDIPETTSPRNLHVEHDGVGMVTTWWNPDRRTITAMVPLHGTVSLTANDSPNRVVDSGFLRVEQNFPNPFNPTTSFVLETKATGRVRVDVFDVRGGHVSTLFDEVLPAGRKVVKWRGETSGGTLVVSGVYFYRVEAGGKSVTRKMVLLK